MLQQRKKYYVYFLQSKKDGSFYIGVTVNTKRRLHEHNTGQSFSTAPKKPWVLRRIEVFETISDAYQRESFLKAKKSRIIIRKIIESGSPDVG